MEPKPVRIFGVTRHDHLEIVPTPTGQCDWCDEPIVEGDVGMVMDRLDLVSTTDSYWHIECLMRSIVGSLGHQKKTCSCHGGNEEDPPELSAREAAKAAYQYFKEHVDADKETEGA